MMKKQTIPFRFCLLLLFLLPFALSLQVDEDNLTDVSIAAEKRYLSTSCQKMEI